MFKAGGDDVTRRAIVTIVTRNYAHYAQVLLRNCKRFHPEADLFVVYADRPPQDWQEKTPGTHVVYADQLGIDQWKKFSFQYTPFELSCALKPHAIDYLFRQGYQQIAYIDGDMQLYGPMSEVFDALQHSSILLTPHLLKPLPDDGKRPHEAAFLISGTYNAGFFAVSQDETSRSFVEWWKRMVARLSIVDLASSLFVDQKWLSLVPGMFEGVHLLRHPGYNAGHWSLSQFEFTSCSDTKHTSSGVAVDGKPLVLFHFSGMTPNKPSEYLSSQTRTSLADLPALNSLVEQYHRDLADFGMATCVKWGCQFDTLADGTPIHPGWREAIRQPHKGFVNVSDPFDVTSSPEIVERFKSIESGAYKWRKDWRLKWPKEQGVAGKARSVNEKIKVFLRSFRGSRKSA